MIKISYFYNSQTKNLFVESLILRLNLVIFPSFLFQICERSDLFLEKHFKKKNSVITQFNSIFSFTSQNEKFLKIFLQNKNNLEISSQVIFSFSIFYF